MQWRTGSARGRLLVRANWGRRNLRRSLTPAPMSTAACLCCCPPTTVDPRRHPPWPHLEVAVEQAAQHRHVAPGQAAAGGRLKGVFKLEAQVLAHHVLEQPAEPGRVRGGGRGGGRAGLTGASLHAMWEASCCLPPTCKIGHPFCSPSRPAISKPSSSTMRNGGHILPAPVAAPVAVFIAD